MATIITGCNFTVKKIFTCTKTRVCPTVVQPLNKDNRYDQEKATCTAVTWKEEEIQSFKWMWTNKSDIQIEINSNYNIKLT